MIGMNTTDSVFNCIFAIDGRSYLPIDGIGVYIFCSEMAVYNFFQKMAQKAVILFPIDGVSVRC